MIITMTPTTPDPTLPVVFTTRNKPWYRGTVVGRNPQRSATAVCQLFDDPSLSHSVSVPRLVSLLISTSDPEKLTLHILLASWVELLLAPRFPTVTVQVHAS